MGYDEGVVRRLFGGTTLVSAELPGLLRAYEDECGSSMIPPELVDQIESFAAENADLEIGYDAFMDLVRSLHESVDSEPSDEDDLFDNSAIVDGTTPDTTFESETHQSPDEKGLTRNAFSEHDIASIQSPGKSYAVLKRRLEQANDALERLQSGYDALLVARDEQDMIKQNLERKCAGFERSLHETQLQEQANHARIEELESCVEQARAACNVQKRRAEHANAELSESRHLVSELERRLDEQKEDTCRLKNQCNSYSSETSNLQDTCAAQRTAITKLEETVETLERSHAALEQLQTEYATFHAMHAELEDEFETMRRRSTPCVLAMELPKRRSRSVSAPPLTKWQDDAKKPMTDDSEDDAHHLTSLPPSSASCGTLVVATNQSETLSPASKNVESAVTHARIPLFTANAWQWLTPLGLVLIGMWAGIWVFYIALHSASLSRARWAEANLLNDPWALPGGPGGDFATRFQALS